MKDLEFTEFVRLIIDILEQAEIDYMVGGALALWHWGQARTTQDVDIVVDLRDDQIDQLSALLEQHHMLVPPDIIRENIAESRIDLAINAIHMFSGYKAELFPLRSSDRQRKTALERRIRVNLSEDLQDIFVHAAEDLILYKLHYYTISHQPKHIRDIREILKAEHHLDLTYLDSWIKQLGLQAVWDEVRND